MTSHRRDTPDVLRRIVARRRERLAGSGAGDGAAQGLVLPPGERLGGAQIRPFPGPLVCEIKRRSPSRGDIAEGLDPVTQSRRYTEAGAQAVSVLTEQDHFSGSLADLVAVRHAFPAVAVLRKDFLLTEEDLEIAWRAGADAVLLIAAILEPAELQRLHRAATERGLAALVEVHTLAELESIRALAPPLVGINARDLRTFTVDLLTPLALRARIDWPATVVFESGVFGADEARLARQGRFDSLLVGEAVVKEPRRIPEILAVMAGADGSRNPVAAESTTGTVPFWVHLARRRQSYRQSVGRGTTGRANTARPLVKICGITSADDALRALELGADLLGLIYAPSPRQAPPGLAQELRRRIPPEIAVPLVGVVVEPADPGETGTERTELLQRAQSDLAEGHLGALQLHGDAPPHLAPTFGWPWYKACRPADPARAVAAVAENRGPRMLIDAFHPDLAGGTGLPVSGEVVQAVIDELAARSQTGLWLAGGLAPDNVAAVVRRWNPELIDASSRLESAPGRKDPALLKAFFAALPTESMEEKDG